jgi:DnaJ homolog subfamily C member 8
LKKARTLEIRSCPNNFSLSLCLRSLLLSQAESELSDTKKREELDAVIKQARVQLLKSLSLPSSIADDDPRIASLNPPFKDRIRQVSKDLLIEEELRRRKYVVLSLCSVRLINATAACLSLCSFRAVKMNLANEGLEAKKKEEEVSAKKRKAEEDANWEGKQKKKQQQQQPLSYR